MKAYKVWMGRIDEIEVIKFTEKSVFVDISIRIQRLNRHSYDGEGYFKTLSEAVELNTLYVKQQLAEMAERRANLINRLDSLTEQAEKLGWQP